MWQFVQNETFITKYVSQRAPFPGNPGKEAFFLVSGTVFVAHLFEVRSITVTEFSFYFALIQASSVTKLEFQQFYKSFIEIPLISLFFKIESLN